MNAPIHQPDEPTTIDNPAAWHRRLCQVTPQLFLCGDLPDDDELAMAQLAEWSAAGITDIVDVRIEADSEAIVRRHSPELRYHWLGVDNCGGEREPQWFDDGVAVILNPLADPASKVVVHCHMGVNRGPSMGFAAMLAMGWEPVSALTAIRIARPIAAVLYARDALKWWHDCSNVSIVQRHIDTADVSDWFAENYVNVSWIISRIASSNRRW